MVSWLTKKRSQEWLTACYEFPLGRAKLLDVGGSLWVSKEEVGTCAYGNSKHYTEPI